MESGALKKQTPAKRGLLAVDSVNTRLQQQAMSKHTNAPTPEKNLTDADTVTTKLQKQAISQDTNASTPEKNLTNANTVNTRLHPKAMSEDTNAVSTAQINQPLGQEPVLPLTHKASAVKAP